MAHTQRHTYTLYKNAQRSINSELKNKRKKTSLTPQKKKKTGRRREEDCCLWTQREREREREREKRRWRWRRARESEREQRQGARQMEAGKRRRGGFLAPRVASAKPNP